MKKPLQQLMLLVGLMVLGIGLTSCDDVQTPHTFNEAQGEMNLEFSVYKPVGATTLWLFAENEVQADGTMLAIDRNSGEQTTVNFSIMIDESTLSIPGVLNLSELAGGFYDLYFLLYNGVDYYGSSREGVYIFGEEINIVDFLLSPVVGTGLTVGDLRSFYNYHIDFPLEALASYSNPRMGHIIYHFDADGYVTISDEEFFTINMQGETPQSGVDLLLKEGRYKIFANFYDGSILKDRTIGDDPVELPDTENPVTPDVLPLTAEATVTQADAELPPHFSFSIPLEVIEEAGGPDRRGVDLLSNRLDVTMSLVGPTFPLVEESLAIEPVFNNVGAVTHYRARVDVPSFVTGEFSWALTFTELTSGSEIAYCAETVSLAPDLQSATFLCDVSLLIRTQADSFPVAHLQITVADTLSGPVAGAVVLLNGSPIGITDATTGTVHAFVPSGVYTLHAVHKMLDPFGSGMVVVRHDINGGQFTPVNGDSNPFTLNLNPVISESPTVLSISPPNGSMDVAVNTTIVATFSQRMDPASLELTITPDAAYSVAWGENVEVLTVTPTTDLVDNTSYTVAIGANTANVIGTKLQGPASTSFTTLDIDFDAPSVVGHIPAAGESGVSIDSQISITFSEAMNKASVLDALNPGDIGAFTPSWAGNDTVLTLIPSELLAYDTSYVVSLGGTAVDLAGNFIEAPLSFSFITGQQPHTLVPQVDATFPGSGATGVAIGSNLQVTFNEAMDTASVEAAFSTIPATEGSFSWSGDNASMTFDPAANLQYDTEYQFTISQDAMDAFGIPMAGAESFFFSTASAPVAGQIKLVASRVFRPRQYVDASLPDDINLPVSVQIPPLGGLVNEAGVRVVDGLGNPERFLLFLYLDDMKCMYLGGELDRHIDGSDESVFEDLFKSPVCNKKDDDDDDHGNDDDHNDNYGNTITVGDIVTVHERLSARVITGDPHHPETQVEVVIDIVTP